MDEMKLEFIETTLPDGSTVVQVVGVLAHFEHEVADVAREAAQQFARTYDRARGIGLI